VESMTLIAAHPLYFAGLSPDCDRFKRKKKGEATTAHSKCFVQDKTHTKELHVSYHLQIKEERCVSS